MANVFPKAQGAERSTIDIVRDTLSVSSDGDVSFRCRTGRGSGKAVEIPGSQFDEFVTLLVQTRDCRLDLAQQPGKVDVNSTSTNDEVDSDS